LRLGFCCRNRLATPLAFAGPATRTTFVSFRPPPPRV
jgi:hypothetical protein